MVVALTLQQGWFELSIFLNTSEMHALIETLRCIFGVLLGQQPAFLNSTNIGILLQQRKVPCPLYSDLYCAQLDQTGYELRSDLYLSHVTDR